VTLCDGWITHGAGPEDHAWEQLALIQGALSEAGRDPEGFDIYLAIQAVPDVDLYKRFADAGVTDMLCAPWMAVQLPPDTPREVVQKARLEACERFAEEIIAKVD
jgi:alkanesulfonate monooxygenase SsuD/methylene tetrahydromethanopterin reductase-like flavin-dependent oxidoreductase (luciferase family)